MNALPTPGTVVYLGPACGVPYTFRPLLFAIGSIDRHGSAEGGWLTGYEVNEAGRATDHREIYVGNLAGMRIVTAPAARNASSRNGGPTLPRQRTKPTTTTVTRRTR
jgi:hypothetical protein